MVAAAAVLVVHMAAVFFYVVPRVGRLQFLRLHYTVSLGIDWIAPWWQLFVFPGLGLAVFMTNGAAASAVTGRLPPLARFLQLLTLALEVGLAAAGIIAILLNG